MQLETSSRTKKTVRRDAGIFDEVKHEGIDRGLRLTLVPCTTSSQVLSSLKKQGFSKISYGLSKFVVPIVIYSNQDIQARASHLLAQ